MTRVGALLNRHLQTRHKEEEHFKCNLCEKTYTRKDILKRHLRIKHNINERKAIIPGTSKINKNLHNCCLCESIFNQKSDMNRHMQTVHNSSNIEEKYLCNICNKEFNKKSNLTRHEEIHRKPKINIICEVCLDQFDTKDELRAHRIAVHENNQ